MNINRLLDEWNDPLQELYQKELEVLFNGIAVRAKDLYTLEKICTSLFNSNIPHSRHLFNFTIETSHLWVFSDEQIECKIYSLLNKKYVEKIFIGSDHLKKEISSLYNEIIQKGVNPDDIFITIKVLNRSPKREELETKQWSVKDSNKLAKKYLDSINSFLENFESKSNLSVIKNFLNLIYQEKNLTSLERLHSEVSGGEFYSTTFSIHSQKKIVETILKYQEEFSNQVKIKSEYLDMLLEPSEIKKALLGK